MTFRVGIVAKRMFGRRRTERNELQVRYEKGSLMGIRSVMTEKDLGLFDAADQVYHV